MMRIALFLAAVSAPLLSGCGTLADSLAGPADDHLYYRGVRMDCAGIKNGMPIMALDLPFSACADTLMVPSIAYHQMTDPDGGKHKSAVQVVNEQMVKTVTNDVIVPISVEMMKAEAEMRKQQTESQAMPSATRKD